MSTDSQAAEIELLFLRGALPREIDVPREPIRVATRPQLTGGTPLMRRGSEPRDLSFADATEFLVAQPKPVRCQGRLWRGRLSVTTGAPTSEQLQFHQWAQAVPLIKPWQKVKASVDDPVLIRSGQETVAVSFKAFEQWQDQYVRVGSAAIMGPGAVKEAIQGQPRWAIVVGGTGPVTESYALDENETVLCDRCRQQLAVAVSRDRTTNPVGISLLCEDCLRANVGRAFAREFGMDSDLSDTEACRLLDDMPRVLREGVGKARPDDVEK